MKKNIKKALSFYKLMDNLIPSWDNDLQMKMEFARDYMNNMTIKKLKNSRILLGPMDEKILQYLIFSILLEYDYVKEFAAIKKLEEDTFYLSTEEIFPNREMTPSDVMFIESILDKLHVDLESEKDERFIMSKNQILYLVRGIMREYDTFLSNGSKVKE